MHLDQTTDFRYEEGARRATSNHATLEQAKDLITLEGSARIWDPTGTAAADRMVLNQKTGDFTADGRVATTRLPDQKPSHLVVDLGRGVDARALPANDIGGEEPEDALRGQRRSMARRQPCRGRSHRHRSHEAGFEAHGKVASQLSDKSAERPMARRLMPARRPLPPADIHRRSGSRFVYTGTNEDRAL